MQGWGLNQSLHSCHVFIYRRQKTEMERMSQVGQCLNIIPCSRSHTVLEEHKLRDNAMLCCQERTNNFPEKCDVCALTKNLTLKHELQYKSGGLVMGRQIKVWNYLDIMVTQALYSYFIDDEPTIYFSWYGTLKTDPWVSHQENITINLSPEHRED